MSRAGTSSIFSGGLSTGRNFQFTEINQSPRPYGILLLKKIKKIRLRCFADHPDPLRLEAQGACQVTAGAISTPSTVEIVNPDLHLATLDNDQAHLSMELRVGTGRGFVAAHPEADQAISIIPIDAIYSPIVSVKYTIDQALDQSWSTVSFALTTDGTISPGDALRESTSILIQQFRIFANYSHQTYPQVRKAQIYCI